MALIPGSRLGPYEVVGPIGSGGMGEVYRAHDTKLGRDVALKILPDAFAEDPDRLARFEREARMLATLHHPNIAQIFGFEDSTGVRAFAMELVEGPTLDELLRNQRSDTGAGLPIDQALRIARQLADALEAAHEAGIVHRDLKPANIKVRVDGKVKVLDFGLAKATVEDDPVAVDAPTATSTQLTQVGSVMGTAAYMSPEQARGRAVDTRTDIWAFGVIVFEMFTGHPLFAGDTVADTIAAVLTREPDFSSLPAAVPANVRALLARCLERDTKQRLRDIGDALHELEDRTERPHGRRVFWIAAGFIIALTAMGGFAWNRLQRPSPATEKSIAVLPFVNQSGNADDEYFSDGMTDELASALTKVPGLRVAARSSAFNFKGHNTNAQEVGSKLHVGSMLEGTVRRAGSKLRVTAQLVNTSDGLAIWSERYERDASDVFKVQDDITEAIVAALRLTLGSGAPVPAQLAHGENAEAHDLYLRGRFFMFKVTEESLRKALDYYDQALEKDPTYAPAYAGKAFVWAWLADSVLAPKEAYPKAKAAAQKALELDPGNVEARTNLGIIRFVSDWNVKAAEEEFHRALRTDPNSMDAHNFYGLMLCASNRFAEGVVEADRAIALDPLNAAPSWTREYCLLIARRWDDVIEQHKRTKELDPNLYYLDAFAGAAYREKTRYPEAVAEYLALQRVVGVPLFGLAVTYARMGQTAEARAILLETQEVAKHRYVSPELFAAMHANLGDPDRAFEWLDKALEARSGALNATLLFSAFDPIRSDPRFAAILEKVTMNARQ